MSANLAGRLTEVEVIGLGTRSPTAPIQANTYTRFKLQHHPALHQSTTLTHIL